MVGHGVGIPAASPLERPFCGPCALRFFLPHLADTYPHLLDKSIPPLVSKLAGHIHCGTASYTALLQVQPMLNSSSNAASRCYDTTDMYSVHTGISLTCMTYVKKHMYGIPRHMTMASARAVTAQR